MHRLCSGLLALLLLSVAVVPSYAAEGPFGGGSVGGGAGRSDFFTWTNGFGGGSYGGGAGRDQSSAAYDDYVQTLPAPGYISSGRLIWQPSASDFISGSLNSFGGAGWGIESIPWEYSPSSSGYSEKVVFCQMETAY